MKKKKVVFQFDEPKSTSGKILIPAVNRRSPIEVMVDKACGLEAWDRKAPDTIELWCPTCRRGKIVSGHPTDPKGTVNIEIRCPQCEAIFGCMFPVYRDANNKVLALD